MPTHELVAAPLLQQDLVVPPSEDSDLAHEGSSEPPDAVPPAEDEGLADAVPPAEDEGLVYDYEEGIKTTFFPPPSYLAVPSFTKTTTTALLSGAKLAQETRARHWLFLSSPTNASLTADLESVVGV